MLDNRQDTWAGTNAAEADSRTSLEQVISLLQGGQGAPLADAGLARLGAEQLNVLRRHASYQAALCLERASQLLRLMLHCAEHHEQHLSEELTATATQVAMLSQERERWTTLAENAQYYQQNPDIAARILCSLT
jgi:hypothetical protein